MSETGTYPTSDLATSQLGKAWRLRIPDAPGKQQARHSSARRLDVPDHRTASQGVRPRLLPFAVAVLMVFSAVLAGPAFASPAAGKWEGSDHAAQRREPDRALARLVLSPAGASMRAGSSQEHTATGPDAAGPAKSPRHQVEPTRRPVKPPRRLVEPPRRPVRPPRGPVESTRGSVKPPRRLVEPSRRPVQSTRGSVEPTRRPVKATQGPVEPTRRQAGRPKPLARLVLSPTRAFISSGGSLIYHVEGYDPAGNPLGDLTVQTTFSIRFSAAKTSHRIRPDGSCIDNVCTATKYGRHTITATLNLEGRTIGVTAALQVVPRPRGTDGQRPPPTSPPPTSPPPTSPPPTSPPPTSRPGCVPSATDVRGLEVAPRKVAPGARVQITAQITRRFGACSVSIFLDGSQFGGDAAVGPDGNLSVQRTVPNDAKPGITIVRLATTGGRTLATTSFEVLPRTEAAVVPAENRGLPWLLFVLGLLFLLLVVSALLRERARRQRRWVRHHFRAEPHPSADDLTSLDQDPESEPSFSFRLQPHGDAGTQTLKEGD
jgi:hypothetical protein